MGKKAGNDPYGLIEEVRTRWLSTHTQGLTSILTLFSTLLDRYSMKGICKLCQNERDLRQSHVIPEFMYQNVYDQNPKRYYHLDFDTEAHNQSKSKILQKGVREYLLCDECEGKLSKWERYTAIFFYAKTKGNTAFLKDKILTADGYKIYVWANVEYGSFKLFLMSLLWRLIISTQYTTPEVDVSLLEKLRLAILAENPLTYDVFGCLLQVLYYPNGKKAGKIILAPYITQSANGDILNIFIDGFLFSFYLNSEDASLEQKEFFLNEQGNIQIVGRQALEDPILRDKLKAAVEFFKTFKDVSDEEQPNN